MSERHVSVYSVIKGSWGIWIQLGGWYEFVEVDEQKSDYIELVIGERVQSEFSVWLQRGLEKSTEMMAELYCGKHLVICIEEVCFNPCDFQIEGIEAAMIKWVEEALSTKKIEVNVSFNKEQNKYSFKYPNDPC